MNNQLHTINSQGVQLVNPVWAEEENYGMVDWIKKCFRNYANFSGRARRKEYWFFYLFTIITNIVLSGVDRVIGAHNILTALISLAMVIPTLAVTTRRLHDINRSGWWQLIVVVPFIIFIGFLVSMFASGSWKTAGVGLILATLLLLVVAILLTVWYATDTKPETNQWGLPARRV